MSGAGAFAYRFRVAYDGKGFAGWQRQPALRTVQSVLTTAATSVLGHETLVRGASRTDAGVHAIGQVAACDADGSREIPPRGFVAAMNAALPDDVAIREAEIVERGYDPRFDAAEKRYRYLVRDGGARDPLLAARVWQLGHALDADAMRSASAVLLGTHDFSAFRAADDGRPTAVRTLTRLTIERPAWDASLLAIEVDGTAFLKNMVRILVGTLVEVGAGRRPGSSVRTPLESLRREDAGPTAPPEGLYLVRVELGRRAARSSS